jgi:ubiquinone/menaquinone biosynthesis C-methylase UbiE
MNQTIAINTQVRNHFGKLAEDGVWASLYSTDQRATSETWSFVIRARRIVELLQASGTTIRDVADIGCGTAPVARTVAAMGCRYVGVDFSGEMIDAARRNLADLLQQDRVELSVGDATRLSLPDQSCDAAVAMGLLEYFTRPAVATVLEETARIVRPGGVAILTIPKRHHWGTFVRRMFSALRPLVRRAPIGRLKLERPEQFERLYLTPRELDEACARVGLRKIDQRHYNLQPFCRPATVIAPRLSYLLNRPFELLARVPGASFLATGYIGMYRREAETR